MSRREWQRQEIPNCDHRSFEVATKLVRGSRRQRRGESTQFQKASCSFITDDCSSVDFIAIFAKKREIPAVPKVVWIANARRINDAVTR